MRWIDAHPGRGAGTASVEGRKSVAVPWKGEPPQEFRALIASLRGVRVDVVSAAYSIEDLQAEAYRVAASNPDVVASAGPSEDFNGLDVEVTPSAGISSRQTMQALETSIPVTIVGESVPAPASRYAQASPFYGGAMIFMPVETDTKGYACTAGVPVFTSAGNSGLTTARHCGATAPWRSYGSGYTIGSVSTRNAATDTQIILGTSSSRIWTRNWDSTTSAPIYNAERPANGSRICIGGAVLNESCTNNYVRGTNMTVNVSGVGPVGPGYWVQNEPTGSTQPGIIRGGNSGGPSFSYTSTSWASVKGLQIAMDTNMMTSLCSGNPAFTTGQPCYARGFMVNVVDALSAMGARLKTS